MSDASWPAARAATREDRDERADEGEPVHEAEPEDETVDGDEDADRGPEGGAARGAQHVRVGERVAQQPLERRPREAPATRRRPCAVRTRGTRRSNTIVSAARGPGDGRRPADDAVGDDGERVGGRDRHLLPARSRATSATRRAPMPIPAAMRPRRRTSPSEPIATGRAAATGSVRVVTAGPSASSCARRAGRPRARSPLRAARRRGGSPSPALRARRRCAGPGA